MLKKLLLSLSLLVATVATHANTLTILNLTGCAYFVDLNEGGRVYVTPISSTFFADPSQVGAGAPATGVTGRLCRCDRCGPSAHVPAAGHVQRCCR